MQIQAPGRSREHHPIRCITLVKAAAVAMLALLVSFGGGGNSSAAPDERRGDHVNVTALFATNGAQWNDYVKGNVSTATDTACNAATDTACLHGGERRAVVAYGKTSCSGLVATDDLGAFNWVCDDSRKPVRLISTGLANGKFLSDLIDFTTKQFKPNKVTVKANGIAWFVTPSTVWWTNPIVEHNGGGSLATASTLYLVTNNPAASYFLDADKVALVIQPGLILTGPGTNGNVIFSNHHYLWLEGAINASGENIGVLLDSVRFSMLRNVAAGNSNFGVILVGATNNTLSGVTASNNTNVGVLLADGSNNNTLLGVTASNNTVHGVLLDFASNNNTLSGVTASNNALFSVTVANTSNNNTLSGVTVNNNAFGVFLVDASNNNTLSGVTASNNSEFGVLLTNASKNNTLSEVAASNNTTGVALANFSDNNTLSGVAASNNNTGVILSESSNNRFTGLLKVGYNSGDCGVIGGGTLPGLDDFTCANNGSSDATLTVGITLAGSFVGKVTSDDTKNANDTNGTADFPLDPAVFDWTHFDNAYRGWGLDGSAFPDLIQRGRWATGAGRIWDWSVSTSDNGANGTPSCTTATCPALLRVLALPTGNDTLTHLWSGTPGTFNNAGCDAMVAGSTWNGSACGTTFLRNAVEIPGDGGNDNNLCESGETCLYTPNIGSYQGHGDLESAGIFIDGLLTGISLIRYKINGR